LQSSMGGVAIRALGLWPIPKFEFCMCGRKT